MKTVKIENNNRICCTCGHNIRTEQNRRIVCNCDIDGHEIGYIECFEHWCRHWKSNTKWDSKLKEKENGGLQ